MENIPLNKEVWPTGYFGDSLREMAETITQLELWEWFRKESPPKNIGYSWWIHPNIDLISEALVSNNHSGASFACAMRNMQIISIKGFVPWKTEYTNNY
jgi:hypothetical protein